MKIAINRCFGGFSLSDKAFECLIEKGWKTTKVGKDGHCIDKDAPIIEWSEGDLMLSMAKYSFAGDRDDMTETRTNPDLIAVIEELGKDASGSCGNIKVVEIPDDVSVHIEEYDGQEWVAEDHRTWR